MEAARRDAPDFLLIGAKKAGTTTLYRWLQAQPEVHTPRGKEPHYFSGARWDRGPSWYQGLFADRRDAQLTGEASTSYSEPATAAISAERIASHAPDVRLVFIARHPIDRLRSHYEHEVLRSRERRSLDAVLDDPSNVYANTSCYFACLSPYIERFDREQLIVVRAEDLFGDGSEAWESVLAHLGLDPRVRPPEVYNATESKPQFTRPMQWLWIRGLTRPLERSPKMLRAIGRRVLLRDDPATAQRVSAAAAAPIESSVVARIERDAAQLAEWLGANQPLWDLSDSAR